MALSGQLNVLANEIKSLLTDGVETTGFICTDGSPAYLGTGTGEDLDGYTIYAADLGDVEADDFIETLPCVRFKGDSMPVEYMQDAETIYQADFVFEISFPFHHSKTIDSTLHEYSALMNWTLERIQFALDLWTPQAVMHSGKMNTGAMNLGKIDTEHDLIYYGQSFLSISFASDGGNI